MAEVRVCLGMRPCNFVYKRCHRYFFESQRSRNATKASSLAPGFLLYDIKNVRPHGADPAVDRVTGEASPRSYTRVAPLFNSEHYPGLIKVFSLSKKKRVKHTRTFWRKFCTFGSARRQQSPGVWGGCVFIRAFSGNGPRAEPLYKTQTGYYDILEVSPTATHAQIKTAYYKQSFIYHPDKNAASEDATHRFSEISEAYTVLGNKALRKKYDRGLLSQSDLTATVRPSAKDKGTSAKEPTGSRRSVVGADSQEGVFDFDQFFKAHYNEQLQRDRNIRARREERLRKKHETIEDTKTSWMAEVGVAVMIFMATAIVASLKR